MKKIEIYTKVTGSVIVDAPELTLSINTLADRVEVKGEDFYKEMTVEQFYEDLKTLYVLNRVRETPKATLEKASETYANEVVDIMRQSLKEKGGEWNLPSMWNEDEITVGEPPTTALPKTLYLDSQDNVMVSCETVEMGECDEMVKYPTLSVGDIDRLADILERPIDEDE